MLQSQYQLLDIAGSGNFSSVHKAKDNKTGQTVAVKVMQSHEKIGLRQAQLLKEISHPNIVKLINFQQTNKTTKMVLQYMPQNTLQLYQAQYGLTQEQTKCIMFQSALALAYIHEKGVIHRDIKPQNILIDKSTAQTKIIDFGLAVTTDKINTDYVATRWYRAPENLLGTKQYTTAIDVFSLACVAVELYLGQPLFPGSDNLDQLYKIFNVLGEPSSQNWPKGAKKFRQLGFKSSNKQGLGLQKLLKSGGNQMIDLITKMLALDPSKRITSWQVLQHPYFKDVHNIIPPNSYKYYLKQSSKKVRRSSIRNSNPDSRKQSIRQLTQRSKEQKENKQKTELKYVPKMQNIDQKDASACGGNDCGISFRGANFLKRDRQTYKEKEKEKTQPQSPTPVLSFRGFNPVKAAKIPVRQAARMNNFNTKINPSQLNSPRDSRNNSIESTGRKIGNNIETLKKMIKNIGETSTSNANRRISADAVNSISHRTSYRSIDKGSLLYHMQEGGVQRGSVPYVTRMPLNNHSLTSNNQSMKSNRIMTINQQASRLTRNLSEVNAHSQRVGANMPLFLRDKKPLVNTSNTHAHLHSPNPLKAHSPNPLKTQTSPQPIGKQSIYTSPTASFSKPLKKLKLVMPQKDHTPTDRSYEQSFHSSRVEQHKKIPSTIEDRRDIKPHQFFTQSSQLTNPRVPAMALSPMPSFKGKNPAEVFEKYTSPQSKIKQAKSMDRCQTERDHSKFINPSPNPSILRRQSINKSPDLRPSVVLTQKKEYREPKISIRRQSKQQVVQNLSSFLRSNTNQSIQPQNKNININLSLNIVDQKERRRGRI